ncbi:MAG: substrate-binding domain-containing protein [Verrucomicrobiota bacterium JB023]|nr:substrate-binding domain-containing protein [Verrucomicrobiota bacterium JB023]
MRYVPGFILAKRSDLVVWQLNIYHDMADMLSLIEQWKPDAMVVEYLPGISEPLLETGIPTVAVQYDFAMDSKTSFVDVDDVAVGQLAAEFFLEKRLENFAFYGKAEAQFSEQRLQAFRETIKKNGFEVQVHEEEAALGPRRYTEYWPEPSGSMVQWLCDLPKPCGLFAAHDPLGRAAIEASVMAGVEVPRELAVLGVNDDLMVCLLSDPKLSSIRIPWARIGQEMLVMLDAMLAGEKGVQQKLISPGSVAERFSSDVLAVENPLVRRALELIRSRLSEGVAVQDLVAELGCSRRHLERLFATCLGHSPKDEINFRRISAAKDLLLHSNQKIATVAAKVGFKSVERFYAVFRESTGKSPGQFRKG